MSILTPDLIENYINSLYRQEDEQLIRMRAEAERLLVPIVTRDMERLLTTLCSLRRPKTILEIGTAIGYSALCFAKAAPEAQIITLENRERSVHKARANIREAGLEDRIRVIEGDAGETLAQVEGIFDLIFIDAAKGQYRRFFDLCEKNMVPGTLVVSDNVLYKGMPCDESYVPERRHKTIARRMDEYLSFLTADKRFETSLLAIGDGVAISYYK